MGPDQLPSGVLSYASGTAQISTREGVLLFSMKQTQSSDRLVSIDWASAATMEWPSCPHPTTPGVTNNPINTGKVKKNKFFFNISKWGRKKREMNLFFFEERKEKESREEKMREKEGIFLDREPIGQ